MKKNKEMDLDVLKQVEDVSKEINDSMSVRTKSVFKRYPLTFMLLALVGIVALSNGMKDLITNIPFFDGHPWRLSFTGLFILILTGTLYKKLDK